MEQIPLGRDEAYKNKLVLVIVSSVLISVLVAGGGVYAYQKSQADEAQANMQAQIDDLKSDLADATQAITTPTPSPTASIAPSATSTPQATATPAAIWKTYTNTRVGYQFEYNENDSNIDVDETFKYSASKTYPAYQEADRIQFVYNKNTYAVSTYVSSESSLEVWMTKNYDTGGTDDISKYSKTTIGGKAAYSDKSKAASFVMNGDKVIVVYGREPAGHTMKLASPSDAMYSHVLSTLEFTK